MAAHLKAKDNDGIAENKLECRQITQPPVNGVGDLVTVAEIGPSENKQREKNVLISAGTELLNHESQTPANNSQLCKEHSEVLEYYCEDCNMLICRRGMADTHLEHSSDEAARVLPDHINNLRSMVHPAQEIVDRAEAAMKQLRQDSESIGNNRSMCADSLREVFNKMRSALDKREEMLLETVNKYVDAKLLLVERELKTLEEERDQMSQVIDDLQKLLEKPPSIMALNKGLTIMDELDTHQQGILEVENKVLQSMYSSSYVGFRDDNVKLTEKNITQLVSLCEFYPEADSGYYSSREITVGDENPYVGVVSHSTQIDYDGYSMSESDVQTDYESDSDDDSLPYETPTVSRKTSMLSSFQQDQDHLPPVPIRFNSLLAPNPLLEPRHVFDKLDRLKSDKVYPCGVCVCMNDSLVVSDLMNHCLRIIASNGKFIDIIGSEGKGSGEFEEPCGLAVDNQKNILVAQRVNPRVQKFTSSGKFIQKFGQKSLLGGASVLGEPWAIAVSPDGTVYISDWDKSCIHVFQHNGKYLRSIGNEKVSTPGSFRLPAGIAVDHQGRLLVTDRENHCIWILQQDGELLGRFGSEGQGPGELYYPYGIAVTKDGTIVVTESGNNRVSLFSSSGQFQRCFGRKGSDPGMFDQPRHACVNSKGEIIIADEMNKRLQVFSL